MVALTAAEPEGFAVGMDSEPDITEVLRQCASTHDHVGYTLVAADLLENAANEIERLRGLIVKWADADDDWTDVSAKDGPERSAYAAAHDALRREVGR